MSNLADTLHKFAITYRAESKETRKTDLDKAEKEILETHIPKSQLPSKKEIFKLIFDWDGKDDGELATAIKGLYEKV